MAIPPMGIWANDVGDYTCRCWFRETDKDTCVVIVVENGKEVERETISTKGEGGWHKPFEWAEAVRPKYMPRYHEEIRKALREAGLA